MRRPRAEQLSFVLHLGDFIYEIIRYPEDAPDGLDRGRRLRGNVRYPTGKKVRNFHFPVDLNDYRAAYRGFLSDPDLQDARARWPFVPVWDNHEFAWNGYQSQAQIFTTRRALTDVENRRSRPVRIPAGARDQEGALRVEPAVTNTPLGEVDARGLSHEANNITAIQALRIERAFRFGKNIDMILTDNRSYMSAPIDGSNLPLPAFGFTPEIANDVLEAGREYAGGSPPATIRFGETEVPNPQVNEPPQAYLGIEQMAWFKDACAAEAPWKIQLFIRDADGGIRKIIRQFSYVAQHRRPIVLTRFGMANLPHAAR
jgi:alkaline phosphatase D